MTLKEKSILFIGLRNAIGAARSLAVEFRDAMQMQQQDKKRYNDLAAFLNSFSKSMIPVLSPLTAQQKRDMMGFDMDYTAVLMSVGMQLAVLNADAIPRFIEDFEALIDKYNK
jgi:hypothetical protein